MPAADPADPLGPIGSAVQRWLTDAYPAVYHLAQHGATAAPPTETPQPTADPLAVITMGILIALGILVLCLGIALARQRRVRNHHCGTT